jgi:hypothetical protein
MSPYKARRMVFFVLLVMWDLITQYKTFLYINLYLSDVKGTFSLVTHSPKIPASLSKWLPILLCTTHTRHNTNNSYK